MVELILLVNEAFNSPVPASDNLEITAIGVVPLSIQVVVLTATQPVGGFATVALVTQG